jgi:predicted amidohydrolase YtcJ
LHGGTILPGFIDAHAHPVFAGDQLRRCDLGRADTAPGYAALVAAYARDHPDGEWITGGGWSMDAFPADFAIVNADLAHLPAQEICQARVTQTWIRGQVVYQQQ